MRLLSLAVVAVAAATPSTCEYLANRPPVGAPSPVASAKPTPGATTAPTPSPVGSPTNPNLEAARDAFDRYDLDQDKALSETEYVEGRFGDVRFFKAPTEAEVATMKQGFREQFAKLDLDKSGRLSFEEFLPGYGT